MKQNITEIKKTNTRTTKLTDSMRLVSDNNGFLVYYQGGSKYKQYHLVHESKPRVIAFSGTKSQCFAMSQKMGNKVGFYILKEGKYNVYAGTTRDIFAAIKNKKSEMAFDKYKFTPFATIQQANRRMLEFLYKNPTIYNSIDFRLYWFIKRKNRKDLSKTEEFIDKYESKKTDLIYKHGIGE